MSRPLLPFPPGCVVARLVRREKRFFVHVLIDGKPDVAHTNNTGSMLGLLRPGAPVLLSPAQNPDRKLLWTLELVWCGGASGEGRGFWAGVNTSTPNRMLEAAFRAGRLPWTAGYTAFSREKKRGESRLDGLFEGPGLPRLWVECKNVTMSEDDVALFPDAVSDRGLKHLGTLKDIVSSGERAAMFYCVQRPDARCFGPADMIDPAYAAGLYDAVAHGVEVYAHLADLSVEGIGLRSEWLRLVGGEPPAARGATAPLDPLFGGNDSPQTPSVWEG